MNTQTVLRCKVAIVGDAKVGKTALESVYREGGNAMPKNYSMTQGVEIQQKSVPIPNTTYTVELYIVDTSGQEIYEDLVNHMLQGVNFLMCCYDVTNAESFQSCENWIQKAEKLNGSDEQSLAGAIVATKMDLQEFGEVVESEAQRLAESRNFAFFQTSAINGDNVDAPFSHAAQYIYEAYHKFLKDTHDLTV